MEAWDPSRECVDLETSPKGIVDAEGTTGLLVGEGDDTGGGCCRLGARGVGV